ncbi:hypothetical protein LRP52_32280 [Photobacterium sp. ZSDE20]|uniref:OmpR/PhoB-type domain-containing protein n=1 Tax=Photobacterium pectinilyticum TaxID=2906793 RepID=A0ABT1N8I8_9GAMM|nr:hypothetical protein [Photobacterium sp. ZSDE20]MCQ1059996.1 hypothetical protein [Photobacterium sp. ZSDE20]MDD1826866.1 hypothetical protein [Photobacterium sp. ZSDE20]
MTTQSLTRCFRFPDVDFEPDVHLLVWRDKTQTTLTLHESRLLEALCYCAGEVISHEQLHNKTFSQLDPYEDGTGQHYDLNNILRPLTVKLNLQGKMAIPIEVVPHYGFRVPLPEKTCRLVHEPEKAEDKDQVTPPNQNEEEELSSATEEIVKTSTVHKISVAILALMATGVITASFLDYL